MQSLHKQNEPHFGAAKSLFFEQETSFLGKNKIRIIKHAHVQCTHTKEKKKEREKKLSK